MMPGEVRLSLLLIEILNYMWIDAMFLNHREVSTLAFTPVTSPPSSAVAITLRTIIIITITRALQAGDDCLLKLVCLDSSWIFRRFSAIVIAFCLHVPAMRIMYV